MLRTYKYLLRPTPEQAKNLDFLLWQSRLIYNAALEQRITTYRETGKGVGHAIQWKYFRDLRHDKPDTFGLLNATSVQQLLRRLDKTFATFFRKIKAGEKAGFPRFKGRNRFKSIEFTYGDGCKLRQDEHGRRSFYIQNVGVMRMCFHRPLPCKAVIKHVVVKHFNDRWYACLMLEVPERVKQRVPTGQVVGIDVGLKSLLALSTGNLIDNPRWLQNRLTQLRRVQRHASHQVKGSNRQRKTYQKISKMHEQIANQRRDYLHKVSHDLVTHYDLIGIEELTLAFMNRNNHLSLSSHDTGLGEFRRYLEYKAEEAGTEIVAVNPRNTSQACSECGSLVPKDLSVRTHHCSYCGLTLDRDVNAARNILNSALQTRMDDAIKR